MSSDRRTPVGHSDRNCDNKEAWSLSPVEYLQRLLRLEKGEITTLLLLLVDWNEKKNISVVRSEKGTVSFIFEEELSLDEKRSMSNIVSNVAWLMQGR